MTSLSWNQKGPAGATGPAGPAGATGPAGPAGATGEQGSKGDPGASRTAAPLAANDARCDGNGGLEVSSGATVVGVLCNGALGAPGPKGDTGEQGPPGNGVVATTCLQGFADVNGDITDGCEVDLSNDAQNCGSVGNAVPPPGTNNASYTCVKGVIKIASCNTGFADANHLVSDGCEVNLLTDPNNCGSVGNPVPPSGYLHANWSCVNGPPPVLRRGHRRRLLAVPDPLREQLGRSRAARLRSRRPPLLDRVLVALLVATTATTRSTSTTSRLSA